MIGWLVRRQLAAAERRLGGSLDHMRELYAHNRGVFWKVVRFGPVAEHRRLAPAAAVHLARLVATRAEDCGPCVQIAVNLAKEAGVSPALIRAVLADSPGDLPGPLADVYHFADRVVSLSGDEGPFRDRLRAAYGEAGLAEVALAVATARVYTTLKRALGHAASCSLRPATV